VREYHSFYSDLAAEFIVALPKRKGRQVLDICNRLAIHPFVQSDNAIRDADGRDIQHVLVGGFLISYWVDHPACKVMIVEVDAVR
jgi:hypothetical protein